jgi:hypothetical protein
MDERLILLWDCESLLKGSLLPMLRLPCNGYPVLLKIVSSNYFLFRCLVTIVLKWHSSLLFISFNNRFTGMSWHIVLSECIYTPWPFHILFYYSLNLEWIKLRCFVTGLRTITHNVKVEPWFLKCLFIKNESRNVLCQYSTPLFRQEYIISCMDLLCVQ